MLSVLTLLKLPLSSARNGMRSLKPDLVDFLLPSLSPPTAQMYLVDSEGVELHLLIYFIFLSRQAFKAK